jgi:2-aminoadipate transaminase
MKSIIYKKPMVSNWLNDIRFEKGNISLSTQLARILRDFIEKGEFLPGSQLPSIRKLAEKLTVNRSIVSSAYRQLSNQGVLKMHVGQGTTVVSQPTDRCNDHDLREMEFTRWEKLASTLAPPSYFRLLASPFSFSSAAPDPLMVPHYALSDLAVEIIRSEGERLFSYGPVQGDPLFRAQVAIQFQKEGLPVDADWVLPIAGATQAWDLVSRLLEPQDSVVLENPSYPGAIRSFSLRPQSVAWFPVDDEGANLQRLEEQVSASRAKLICINPDFQNPTGTTISLDGRKTIAAIARQHRCLILEDGIFRDLVYDREAPYPPIFAFAPERTFLVSTFSKVLAPGLRLGTIVAQPHLLQKLAWIKQAVDFQTPLFPQALAREWLAHRWPEHRDRCRQHYRLKRDLLEDELRRNMPRGVRWHKPEGGFFIWLALPSPLDAEDLLYSASRESVSFLPGTFFSSVSESTDRWLGYLRLSFSAIPTEQIEKATFLLGKVIRERCGAVGQDALTTTFL